MQNISRGTYTHTLTHANTHRYLPSHSLYPISLSTKEPLFSAHVIFVHRPSDCVKVDFRNILRQLFALNLTNSALPTYALPSYLSSTCPLPILYLSSTYPLPMLYLSFTYALHILYLCSTYPLPMLYMVRLSENASAVIVAQWTTER